MRLIDADALWDKVIEHTKDGDVIHRIPPDFIDNAPTVDAEPVRHGHWISYPECGVTKCSQCGWDTDEAWHSNYCPSCGAKMDKEEKDGEMD